MFPRIAGMRTTTVTGGATSTTVMLPNGSNVSGRLIIIFGVKDGTGAFTFPGSPAWTSLDEGDDAAASSRSVCRYRVVTGSEGWDGTDDSVVVTHASETTAFVVVAIAGQHSSTAPALASASGSTGAVNPPSLDPGGWGTEGTIWLAWAGLDASGGVSAAPTNYNLAASGATGGVDGVSYGLAYAPDKSGSVDPGTFTNGSESWRAYTVGIRPAATAPLTFVYGSGGSDGLFNTQVGGANAHRTAARFKATSSSLVSVNWYKQMGSGYGAGDGGNILVSIQTNSGGLPTGTILGSHQYSPIGSASDAGITTTFDSPVALSVGTLYHLVLENLTGSPASNYMSFNCSHSWELNDPLQFRSGDDAAFHYKPGAGAWILRPTHTPTVSFAYADGSHSGFGYMEFYPTNQASISGANWIRQTMTVTGGSKVVDGVFIRLKRSTAGGTNDVTVRLETGAGSLIESVVIPWYNYPTGYELNEGSNRSWWAFAPFVSQRTLTNGQSYNLVLSSPAGGTEFLAPTMRQGSAYGYNSVTYFGDGVSQSSSNSGGSWSAFGDSERDLPFAFMALTAGGSGATNASAEHASASAAANAVTSAGGSTTYRSEVLSDSPIVYLRMGDASGNFNDEIGTNDAVASGSLTYSQTGALANDSDKAIRFGAATGHGQIPSNAGLNLGDVLSVELWVKLTATGSTEWLYTRSSAISCRIDPDGSIHVRDAISADWFASPAGTIADTNFHHVVVTKNGATRALYVDTVSKANTAGNLTLANPTGKDFWIGRIEGSDTDKLDGWLDEFALYTHALTQARVTAHYNAAAIAATSAFPPAAGATGAARQPASAVQAKPSQAAATAQAKVAGPGIGSTNASAGHASAFFSTWPGDETGVGIEDIAITARPNVVTVTGTARQPVNAHTVPTVTATASGASRAPTMAVGANAAIIGGQVAGFAPALAIVTTPEGGGAADVGAAVAAAYGPSVTASFAADIATVNGNVPAAVPDLGGLAPVAEVVGLAPETPSDVLADTLAAMADLAAWPVILDTGTGTELAEGTGDVPETYIDLTAPVGLAGVGGAANDPRIVHHDTIGGPPPTVSASPLGVPVGAGHRQAPTVSARG